MATSWPNSVQTFTNPSAGDSLNSPSHSAQHTTVNDTVEALQQYAGLVLVKTQTIGSGVSSVTVTGAFSSTFDNYRVLVNCDSASASGPYFTLQIGSATTGYYSGRTTVNYATSTVTGASESNASKWGLLGALKTGGGSMAVDLLYPYATERTFLNSFYHDPNTAGGAGSGAGMLNDGTSYTSLTVGVSSGTMSGGTIRVYGYNNG